MYMQGVSFLFHFICAPRECSETSSVRFYRLQLMVKRIFLSTNKSEISSSKTESLSSSDSAISLIIRNIGNSSLRICMTM